MGTHTHTYLHTHTFSFICLKLNNRKLLTLRLKIIKYHQFHMPQPSTFFFFVCGTYACLFVPVKARCLLLSFHLYLVLLRHSLSLNLELTVLSKLADQAAPGIRLSLPSTTPTSPSALRLQTHTSSYTGAGDQTQVHTQIWQALHPLSISSVPQPEVFLFLVFLRLGLCSDSFVCDLANEACLKIRVQS